MIGSTDENALSAGTVGATPVDRSPLGLQYQEGQLDTTARGVLGRGRRSAPNPNALFSTPLSGAQNAGGHAKTTADFSSPEEDM